MSLPLRPALAGQRWQAGRRHRSLRNTCIKRFLSSVSCSSTSSVFSAFKDDHSEFSSALPADDLRTTIPYFFQPVDLSRNAIAEMSARAFCGKESVFFPALEAVIRSR